MTNFMFILFLQNEVQNKKVVGKSMIFSVEYQLLIFIFDTPKIGSRRSFTVAIASGVQRGSGLSKYALPPFLPSARLPSHCHHRCSLSVRSSTLVVWNEFVVSKQQLDLQSNFLKIQVLQNKKVVGKLGLGGRVEGI